MKKQPFKSGIRRRLEPRAPTKGGRVEPGFRCLLLLLLTAATLRAAPAVTTPTSLQWLYADDNRPRGLALSCDLDVAADAWDLRGAAAGQPALASLTDLAPPDRLALLGFAVNGGFWNEHQYPVGVTAGGQGIFAAHAHGAGFAIAGRRAWIGALHPEVRLTSLADDGSLTGVPLELPLNPYPAPRRSPYLVDHRAYPWPVQPNQPAQAVWLKATDGTAALTFNTTRTLEAVRVERIAPPASLSNESELMFIDPRDPASPARPAPPSIGTRYRLELRLEPLKDPVRLVTCAGPILVDDGEVCEGLSLKRALRTTVGIDAEGRRLWMVVLARGNDGLYGVTLAEAARTLQHLGARQAINLDGGSSTTVILPAVQDRIDSLFPLRRPIHHGLFLLRTSMSEVTDEKTSISVVR